MSVDDGLRQHYDGYYTGQSEWRSICAADKAANIVALWDGAARPSIIDIGCGDGALAESLAGFYSTYLGFDISGSGVDAARSRELEAATFEVCDGVHLPCTDRCADLAVLSHVVEHLENPRVLLREAKRIASRVVVEVPLEYTLRTPRDFRWTSTGHINLYSPVLIRQLLQSTGLRVLAETVTNPGTAVFRYRNPGLKGTATWAVREAGLRVARPLATQLFTYHWCGIAEADAGACVAPSSTG